MRNRRNISNSDGFATAERRGVLLEGLRSAPPSPVRFTQGCIKIQGNEELCMESMTSATEAFINKADWLGVDDQAAISAIRHTARALDEHFTASLMAQWRGLYNELRNRKVDEAPSIDQDEALLRGLGI